MVLHQDELTAFDENDKASMPDSTFDCLLFQSHRTTCRRSI